MATYIILTRISPDDMADPKDFKKLAEKVSDRIKKETPAVKWRQSFATLGRFDVVDIVESDDPGQVSRAAMIIRSLGHGMTETLLATPWKEFLFKLE